MTCCRKMYARKAAWLAFGLVALAVITSTAQEAAAENSLEDALNASPDNRFGNHTCSGRPIDYFNGGNKYNTPGTQQ
ncbi:ERAD-associated protein [Marasmius tenuissimus]|uniref:ERAD-associated protein n=1 Tax=Marasmius tenuissimus TaxID=585030 RepID=A0ABR3AG31_9AGAR